MVARRRAAAAPDRPGTDPSGGGGRIGSGRVVALAVALLLVTAGLAVASYVVRPAAARSFALVHGSVFLNDDADPVALDLATGRPTVQLAHAFTAVSAQATADLDVLPLAGHATLLLDTSTGEFNVVDADGYLIKTDGGGVRLPHPGGTVAVAAGRDAYLVRADPAGSGADVYLVSPNTVASAVGTDGRARARAFAHLPGTPAASPGTRVASAGALWAVVDDGAAAGAETGTGARRYRVVRLSVPHGSDAGARLVTRTQRTFTAAAGAVALAAARPGDGTPAAVGLAGAGTVTVFTGHRTQVLRFPSPGAIRQILPAGGLSGRLAYLYRTDTGWTLVTVVLGRGGAAARVSARPVTGWQPGALAAPAASRGLLYTIDTTDGTLWQLDGASARRVPGTYGYPIVSGEPRTFTGAEVLAVGDRVIYNVRSRDRAVVVFTDGSSAPLAVDKRAGVRIDPSGTAALADAVPGGKPGRTRPNRPNRPHRPPPHRPPPRSAPPDPVQAVTDRIDCHTSSQVPHVPQLQLVERGSRSVRLHWAYPPLDPTDCAPSTYVVSVQTVSPDAPAAPASVRVQGQVDLVLGGLFPDTTYRLTVTAYLNGRGTPSSPVTVTTSPEGPAAPTDLHTEVDDQGNWLVSWSSCGGVTDGCIPALGWEVVPRFCDGVGLSDAPAPRSVPGDPTQHGFRIVYPGGDRLLGRGLSFSVEGIGAQGLVGGLADDATCTRSWRPPVPGDLTVRASAPAGTAGSAQVTSTTVSVTFAAGAVHDLGGVGGRLTYRLVDDRGDTVATTGPTTATTATLGGITAGRRYQVVVTAAPPGHPEAAVTLAPTDVAPAVAAWPVPTVTASADDAGSYTSAVVSVTVGLSGADTRGESFDFVDSVLRCGNTALALQATDVRPGDTRRFPVDRAAFRGPCTVRVRLVQHPGTSTSPPLYGAGPSRAVTSAVFSVDPPALDPADNRFTARWTSADPASPQVGVAYSGGDPFVTTATSDWSMTVTNGTTADCGHTSDRPTAAIDVDPACVDEGGPFRVLVRYSYFGQPEQAEAEIPAGGAPHPVNPSAIHFDLPRWVGSSIQLGYRGPYDQHTLDELHWTITVRSDASDQPCAADQVTPSASGDTTIAVDVSPCAGPTPTPTPTPTPSPTPTGSGTGSPGASGPGTGDSSGSPTDTPSDTPTADPIPPTYTVTIGLTQPIYGTSATFGPYRVAGVPVP